MKAIVSEKGQVTIPKAVRDRLGLNVGTVVEFEAEEGRLVGRKRESTDRFHKWRGACKLPGNMRVDDYLEAIRE